MIAHDHRAAKVADDIDALAGVGVISNHITQAEETLHTTRTRILQDTGECLKVRMNVGKDSVFHLKFIKGGHASLKHSHSIRNENVSNVHVRILPKINYLERLKTCFSCSAWRQIE